MCVFSAFLIHTGTQGSKGTNAETIFVFLIFCLRDLNMDACTNPCSMSFKQKAQINCYLLFCAKMFWCCCVLLFFI